MNYGLVCPAKTKNRYNFGEVDVAPAQIDKVEK